MARIVVPMQTHLRRPVLWNVVAAVAAAVRPLRGLLLHPRRPGRQINAILLLALLLSVLLWNDAILEQHQSGRCRRRRCCCCRHVIAAAAAGRCWNAGDSGLLRRHVDACRRRP